MSFKPVEPIKIASNIKLARNNKEEIKTAIPTENKEEVKSPRVFETNNFVSDKTDIPYINCTVEDVDRAEPIESKIEFSILARPYIRDSDMYTGDVTITISKCGTVVESTYTIYYFLNNGWKAVIHKRLGAPLTLSEIIDELCWILPAHIDDTLDEEEQYYIAFNSHLAEEFAKRIKYFSRHINLTKRYKIARSLILGTDA